MHRLARSNEFGIFGVKRKRVRRRKCMVCKKYYLADVRHVADQKYCKQCGKKQREIFNKKYWDSKKGKRKKRLQNQLIGAV